MSLVRHVVACVVSQRGVITPAEVYHSLTRKGVAIPLRRYANVNVAKQAVRMALLKAKLSGRIRSPMAGFYSKN